MQKIILTDEQQARHDGDTAARLRAILEETRTAHELAVLAHAAEAGEERLHEVVAAQAAVDTAMHGLVNFIIRGACYARERGETEAEPLHELCRKARLAVSEQIQAVLTPSSVSRAPLSEGRT